MKLKKKQIMEEITQAESHPPDSTNAKQDKLLDHLEISVVESEKRATSSLNVKEYYTVYLIETKVTDSEFTKQMPKISAVWRRYSEFELLRNYLEFNYPFIVIPPVPEKRVMYGWRKILTDTFDPDFVDRRRVGLENFLLRIALHSDLSWDDLFLKFLQSEDSWRESCKGNGYLQKAENTLQNLHVFVHLKTPDPEFNEVKTYSRKLYSNLHELLKVRSRVVKKHYGVCKLHCNYGKVFSEWSAVEKDMGDALQKTGHYLDSLASSIDTYLEDEELLIDQLKEYVFYAEALERVCKYHEQLEYKVEAAKDNVSTKNSEKVKALQGKASFMSRLFGALDAEDVRELKVHLLEAEIQNGAEKFSASRQSLSEFSSKALVDINRFQDQKNSDLRDTLVAYSLLQLKIAKKGLQTWTQIRNCIQNIP